MESREQKVESSDQLAIGSKWKAESREQKAVGNSCSSGSYIDAFLCELSLSACPAFDGVARRASLREKNNARVQALTQ